MSHNYVILFFIVYIKTDDINKGITQDVQNRFATSNYELHRPLPNGKKGTELTKDGLGGKTMTEFVGLRAKAYSYLIDDGSEDKGAQKSVLSKENVNMNFIKTVWKRLKLIIK